MENTTNELLTMGNRHKLVIQSDATFAEIIEILNANEIIVTQSVVDKVPEATRRHFIQMG